MIMSAQEFWQTGSRFYFKRDPVEVAGVDVEQPLIDLGVIQPASPAINPEEAVLEDSDNGTRLIVARSITRYDESYDITCSNFNQRNKSLLFAANPPEAFTQTAVAIVGVVQYAHPGELLKLKNASGAYLYNVSALSITSPALVENTDWEWVSKERGIIRMMPTSATFTAAGNITYTVTPVALTGERLINPQSAGGTITGDGILIYGRDGGEHQDAREFRCSISPQSANMSATEFSSVVLRVSCLADLSASVPAGRILKFKGTLPSKS